MSAGNPYPSSRSNNGMVDDDDGRTRNAKAQRRHREKRKVHLKSLEESVQLLTNQLEDARRQLSSAAYANRMSTGGGPPLSPGGSKDYMAMQQENAYLREENADLRRQLYSLSAGRHYPMADGDAKQESYGAYGQMSGQGQAQGPLASPREGSSGGRDGPAANNNDGFTPRGSRSRVMSSSSAPAVSPYIPSTSAFPTDPRAHALGQSSTQGGDRYPPARYDNIYGGGSGSGNGGNGSGSAGGGGSATHSPNISSAPAPHNMPRSGLAYDHLDMYANRDDSTWGPDAGPPPFQTSAYPVPYSDGPSDEWRQGQDHSH